MRGTLIRSHSRKYQMPRTMWCANFICRLRTEAESNRLFGGSFKFNIVVLNRRVVQSPWCVSQVLMWNYVMLSWRCTNRMSEISSRAEKRATIGCRSVIYHFVLLHYGGDKSIEEFIHTSVLGAQGNQNVLLSICWSNSLLCWCLWIKLSIQS